MDCKKVKEEIVFLIGDCDLGQDIVVAYERHLSLCPDCASKARLTQMVLELVRRRALRRPAPHRLRLKILDRLQGNGSL